MIVNFEVRLGENDLTYFDGDSFKKCSRASSLVLLVEKKIGSIIIFLTTTTTTTTTCLTSTGKVSWKTIQKMFKIASSIHAQVVIVGRKKKKLQRKEL